MRLLKILGAIAGLAILALLAGLAWSHAAMRRERPALPPIADIAAHTPPADRPVRVRWLNTGSQRAKGPADRVVSHPVFVLEWRDGRILLVDSGMDAATVRAFGAVMETFLDAEPAEPGVSIGAALGAARSRVAGIVFTHLHTDHTQGIETLCGPDAPPLPIFATRAQLERANFTTRSEAGRLRDQPCTRIETIDESGLTSLPGLPGVGVIRVAGHTPGSQMLVAWVGDGPPRRYVFSGDVTNSIADLRADRPKERIYRLFIVPEVDAQLGLARRWLRSLEADHGFAVLPSHDQAHIESSGIAAYESRSQP